MAQVKFEFVGNRVFLKSGDRSSELDEGKLVFNGKGLVYEGKKVELEETEKEKSIHLLYARMELENGLVMQLNVFRPKRKKAKTKKSSSLL